jgi:ComF family protein
MSPQTRTSALISAVAPWLRSAVDLIYPLNCLFCYEPLAEAERGVICSSCLGKVKFIEPPFCERCALPFAGAVTESFVCGYCKDLKFHFSRAVAACRAEGVVRTSIHRFKYNREMYYGPHLAEWLAGAARQWIDWSRVNAIVPVPLHPRKKRMREFNQAEYLAVALRHAVQVPVLNRNLRRVKETVTQTALHARERAANLRDAFAVRHAEALAGKRLVLVDDVFTTGATMDSCAKVLLKAGAEDVIALAVARGV